MCSSLLHCHHFILQRGQMNLIDTWICISFLMLPTFCIEVQYSCRERGRWLSNWIEKPLWPNLPTLLHPVEGISKSEEPIKNTSFASQISEPPFALLEFLKCAGGKSFILTLFLPYFVEVVCL